MVTNGIRLAVYLALAWMLYSPDQPRTMRALVVFFAMLSLHRVVWMVTYTEASVVVAMGLETLAAIGLALHVWRLARS